MNFIDLRSDTVTKPSEAMRKAMYEAEVGDDVYKEDPTVNRLEEYAAELLGKESSLFVPSGLMGNQISLNVLTNPGDEVICHKDAHIFQYESGSPSALSGIQLYPLEGEKGILQPRKVEEVIRPKDAYYMPRTRVIEVENTHNRAGGTVYPLKNIIELRELAVKYDLFSHCDGARIWNASAASGIPVGEYAKYFDSISCCLSKGLGAPVGSLIAGNKDFIDECYRVRKAWGGGMRQVGIIAAAGLYALKNNISRLPEDHEKAKKLAEFLAGSGTAELNVEEVETNIIVFRPKGIGVNELIESCENDGLLISTGSPGFIRIVTHMDVDFQGIEKAKEILAKHLTGKK